MHNLLKILLTATALNLVLINYSFSGGLIGSQNQTISKAKEDVDSSRVLSLTHDSMEQRQLQSRKFTDSNDEKVLRACVHVLQDLGFNIDNIEPKLGIVNGSKSRQAVESGQVIGKVIFGLVFGGNIPIDSKQNLVASIVVSSSSSNTSTTIVRVTFARTVWNEENNVSKAERLDDPQIYQEFYDKLSKSLFLEAQNI